MKTSELDYELPPELIARHPARERDSARMMRLFADSGEIAHRTFRELSDLLAPGDLVVMNDTRVFPARLEGRREPHGGRVEALLLEPQGDDVWMAMVRPGRRIRPGDRLVFGPDLLEAIVEPEPSEGAERRLRFRYSGDWWETLEAAGRTPLPPYITKARRDDAEELPDEAPEDRTRYQTVYAGDERGSVAAPTAGLHFTPEVLDALERRGIETARVRLHVGVGTFQPIRGETVEEHPIHREYFRVAPETAERVNRARAEGRRIVAVGTTTVRALETAALAAVGEGEKVFESDLGNTDKVCGDPVAPARGWTGLLIAPGFRFRVTDALLTNFHLPRSSLLALVGAFAGMDAMRRAYAEAIERRYRFYSYGDCMLIEKGRERQP